MEDLKCPICRKPTSVYMGNARKDRLCRKHATMLKNGELSQCPDCGKWNEKDVVCECKGVKEKVNPTNELTCIICGKPSKNKHYCSECYPKIQESLKSINKNESYFSLKDHYYNLKSSIFRIINKKYVITNIYRLVAFALATKIYYKNTDLEERIADDIKYILQTKRINISSKDENINAENPNINSTTDEIIEDKINVATANIKDNRAIDGHLCISREEVSIDDYLYQNEIVHAYNKPVKEIPESERAVVADWFIPISTKGKGKGVYIEYWGIDDKEDYEENKIDKLPLYKKYNVPLIEINKNDIKDTQSLETFLYRKLKENGYPI